MNRLLGVWVVALCVPGLAVWSASASVVQYDDRGAWEAAVGGVFDIETLEDDPIHELIEPEALLGSGLIIDTNPRTVTTEVTDDESFSSNTTPGGFKHLRFILGADYTAMLTAPDDLIGFAFDLTGFQDFVGAGGFNVELMLDDGVVESFFVPDPGDFGPTFHGWVADGPFDTAAMTYRGGDYVGLDQIALAVPEPGSLALLALGLTLLRRR